MEFLRGCAGKFAAAVVAAFALPMVYAASAMAVYVPQDYGKAEQGIVAELESALESFWIPLVIIIAVPLGIKLFKRLIH